MPPEILATPLTPAPTGDGLPAEKRRQASKAPPRTLTALDLTLEEATTLFVELHEKIVKPPRPRPGSGRAKLPAELFCLWRDLLEIQVRRMPETHTFRRKKPRRIQLEILPWEAGYLKLMVRNNKRDTAREEARYNALKTAGEERRKEAVAAGRRLAARVSFNPSKLTDPEAQLAFDGLMDALDTGPRGRELTACLERTEGNVSKAARLLGLPQRTAAHAVARLRRHLLAKGYPAQPSSSKPPSRAPRPALRRSSASPPQDLEGPPRLVHGPPDVAPRVPIWAPRAHRECGPHSAMSSDLANFAPALVIVSAGTDSRREGVLQ